MNEIEVASKAARAAGRILAERTSPVRVRHKGVVDLVTEVDLACEHAVLEVLARLTPDIPVLSEEGDRAARGTRWVVAPLDGTTNYVHGFPVYGVSVALEVDGASEVAVVLDPVRDLLYQARRGKGAFVNGERLKVSGVRDLDRALVGTGFPYDRREDGNADRYVRYVAEVLRCTQGVRRAGAASIDLSWLAAGHLDAFWEFRLRAWDVAAGRLLITEAGGKFTAFDGGAPDPDWPSPLATNGWLHDQMIALLARVDAAERS